MIRMEYIKKKVDTIQEWIKKVENQIFPKHSRYFERYLKIKTAFEKEYPVSPEGIECYSGLLVAERSYEPKPKEDLFFKGRKIREIWFKVSERPKIKSIFSYREPDWKITKPEGELLTIYNTSVVLHKKDRNFEYEVTILID